MKKYLKFVFIFLIIITVLLLISCRSDKSESAEIEQTVADEKIEEQAEEAIEETTDEKPTSKEQIAIEQEEYEEIESLSNILQKASQATVGLTFKLDKAEDESGSSFVEAVTTGIIYSKDGYIITSFTISEDIEKITVTLPDGTQLPGDLVGVDKNTTIAVIKINAQNLESLEFGTNEDVNVGEAVISINKPFGGEMDFSQGFVTATDQNITMSQDAFPLVDLIKTDIEVETIAGGGGFLVNMQGIVIGINSFMVPSGNSEKFLSLTLPSSIATNIADQIIRYGEAKIPYIGIEMGQSEGDILGVKVVGLTNNSPATNAGVEVGDIIVEFDGIEVKDPSQLYGQILRKNVGDLVQLKIYRDGAYVTLSINLVEKPV